MTKSLSEIKSGDEVILRDRRSNTIEVVERTTKCWIILSKGRKFRISDGYPVGERDFSWFNISSIKPATPALKEEIKRKEALRKARHIVRSLTEKVNALCSESDNVAAVIPHLQAAVAALETDPTDNNAA